MNVLAGTSGAELSEEEAQESNWLRRFERGYSDSEVSLKTS